MPDTLTPGTQIGAYRIERLLGSGGMSTVYLAEQSGLKRRVAFKVLSSEIAGDERFRERFIRESELAASLDDPNVLPVFEAGEREGILFIAMRYVDGTDLKSVIRQEGPLDPARTERIVEQVAHALDAAHAKGLIHRDVKPGNILLAPAVGSRAEHVYLADFGLSKRTTPDSSLTATGVFAGTMRYAAPEQFEGRPLDARTDVYSLGCVAFECLTGEVPFRGDQDATLMYAHVMEPPPSATALRPDLRAGVDAVIGKAMAKRPDDRYRSAGELAAALEAAIGERGPALGRARPRAGVRVAIAAALVLGLVAAIVAVGRGDGTRTGTGRSPSVQERILPPSSLARIDPETGEPSQVFRDLPGLSSGTIFQPNLAIGEGAAWLYSFPVGFSAFITHIDGQTGEVRDRLTVPFFPGAGPGLAVGSRTVWFSGEEPGDRVSGINPATDESLEPISIRRGLVTDIVLGDDVLWVGSSAGTLTAFDPLTGKRLDEIPIDATPDAIAYGADSVWAIDVLGNEVIRVNPVRRKVVARFPLAGNLNDIAAGDGGVWVLDKVAGTVMQINPANDTPGAPIRLGPAASGIAVGFGFAWITDAEDGNLYRVDPQLDRATPIPFGTPLVAVAVDETGEAIWVGSLALM